MQLGNNSSTTVTVSANLPLSGNALEYPPLSKADFAQFWFKDPNNIDANDYGGTTFIVYFGNCDSTGTTCGTPLTGDIKPAIEVDTVIFNAGVYSVDKRYYDTNFGRIADNHFFDISGASNCTSSGKTVLTNGSSSPNLSKFYCSVTVGGSPPAQPSLPPGQLILARVRLLYTEAFQKIALGPSGASPLPPQASTYTATGFSGNSSRQIKVFRQEKVVPYFFDFAIFSDSTLDK